MSYVVCRTCGTKTSRKQRKVCGGCKSVPYCSPTCQEDDWSNHKENCLQINKVLIKTSSLLCKALARLLKKNQNLLFDLMFTVRKLYKNTNYICCLAYIGDVSIQPNKEMIFKELEILLPHIKNMAYATQTIPFVEIMTKNLMLGAENKQIVSRLKLDIKFPQKMPVTILLRTDNHYNGLILN